MNLQLYALSIVTCMLSLVPSGQGRGPAQEHTIDLISAPAMATGETVAPERRLTLNQPIAAVSHAPVKRNPIRLDAPHLDRGDYTTGDPFIYEITFENVSDAPIRFPAWPAGDRVDRDAPGATMASVAIRFADENLGTNVVDPQTLAGAETLAGSIIVVQPKERVRIRAQARWVMSRPAKTPMQSRWARALRVKAQLILISNGVTHFVEKSNASSAVLLRR